jgi:transposase-like protein
VGRKRVRQAEAENGTRPDLPTAAEREEIRKLRRENYELRRANEIPKAASVLSPRSSTQTDRSERVSSTGVAGGGRRRARRARTRARRSRGARSAPHVDASRVRLVPPRQSPMYEGGRRADRWPRALGLDPKTVRGRLDRAGVARRPRPRRRELPRVHQTAILAAERQGASVREIAERLRLPPHVVRAELERNDASGGRVVRRIRAALPAAELELSERHRAVVELGVVRRLTHREAAALIGVAPSPVSKELKAVNDRLERL